MTPRPDITRPENMLAIQGDRVLVYRHGANGDLDLTHVLTLVRVMGERQEMRLCNRETRTGKPDWAFTQVWYDRLRPAEENNAGAKWAVTIKDKHEKHT